MLRPLLLRFDWLTEEGIKLIVPSAQCFWKGYDHVKCGDVYNISFLEKDNFLSVFGWVHSEKSSSPLYKVELTLFYQHPLSFMCVCSGSAPLPSNEGLAMCKHVSALLAALEALRNTDKSFCPKRFKRVGLGVYSSAPERMQKKVEFSLTWEEILVRFEEPVPKIRPGGGNVKLVSTKLLTKEKLRKIEKSKPLYMKILTSMNCKELRAECMKWGVSSKGKKSDLIAILSPKFEEIFRNDNGDLEQASSSVGQLNLSSSSSEAPGDDLTDLPVIELQSSSMTFDSPVILPVLKRYRFGDPLPDKREKQKKRRFEIEE